MAVVITGRYTGNLKTELVHEPSGTRLVTAAPVDNQGDGSSFSPTDLIAAGLASCIVTTMAIVAERHGIDLGRGHFRVEKHMTSEPPRRIAKLPVVVHLPASLGADERSRLERAAHTCPVHRSLLEEIEAPIDFHYDL
jgi:putative redox protein